MTEEKIRENLYRRMLERRGYYLVKNRRRDPKAIDFGGYKIMHGQIHHPVSGSDGFKFSLDDVEKFLNEK